MTITRRGLLGLGAAAGLAAVGGCALLPNLGKRCTRAAEKVDRVVSANLETSVGGTFQSYLNGVIVLDAAGAADVLAVFDEAMRAVVTTIHRVEGPERGVHRRIGWITGYGSDGTEVDPTALAPGQPPASPGNREYFGASLLYERYGLG